MVKTFTHSLPSMKTFQRRSKEEVKAFHAKMREMWEIAKAFSETKEYDAAWMEAQTTLTKAFSLPAFIFVKKQLEALGLEGTPYVDTKTFSGWIENGFKVKKGEKSVIDGYTFIEVENKKEGEDNFIAPKTYHLFHRSQVEPI